MLQRCKALSSRSLGQRLVHNPAWCASRLHRSRLLVPWNHRRRRIGRVIRQSSGHASHASMHHVRPVRWLAVTVRGSVFAPIRLLLNRPITSRYRNKSFLHFDGVSMPDSGRTAFGVKAFNSLRAEWITCVLQAAQCLKQAKRLFGPRPGSPLASSGLRNPETPLAPHGPTLQRVDPSSRHAIACRLFDDQENSCPSAPPARLVLTST